MSDVNTPVVDPDVEVNIHDNQVVEEKPSKLREAAEKGQAALLENEKLARQNAILRAGVDVDSPVGAYFFESYMGPPDLDAIRTQAKSMGIMRQAVEENPVTPDEAAGFAAAAGAASGADAPGAPTDEHPNRRAYAAFLEAKREGKSDAVAGRTGATVIIDAALSGDKRVLWDRDAIVQHQREAAEAKEAEGEF